MDSLGDKCLWLERRMRHVHEFEELGGLLCECQGRKRRLVLEVMPL